MRFIFALVLLKFSLFGFVIDKDRVLNSAVSVKIEQISGELAQKTGVKTGVAVYKNLGTKNLEQAKSELNLKSPYAFILLAIDEKKVEIFADEASLKLFNKEQILSPFPERGTILPILASKKGDVYNAAMLNGYADLAEQIASFKGVNLDSAIGSANKTTLNSLRVFIYSTIFAVLALLVFRKFRTKNG